MIRNKVNTSSYVTKDGSTIWEFLHPDSSQIRDTSIAEADLEPGQATMQHVHDRSQEVYYILDGEGTMKLGDESFTVETGDAILIKPGTAHNVTASGRGMRILCICTPPYSHDDTRHA